MCPWTDDRKRSDTSRAWARNSIDATPPAVVRDLNTCRYFVRSQRYVDHEDATLPGMLRVTISPPWAETAFRAMDSPRPSPLRSDPRR
jgi:hypothetical protein